MTKKERQDKAWQLRYKKSIAEGFNINDISDELYEIQSACDDVRYFFEGSEAELIAALDGDEEEAFEVRMLFSEISAEANELYDIINSGDITDCFDDFFAAVAHGSIKRLGYDAYQEDYYQMTSIEQQWGSEEAEKRIMSKTKSELVAAARQCFGVAAAILNIRYKYDYLKASLDILKSENASYLQAIKGIEDAYNAADEDGWNECHEPIRNFDRLAEALPERAWLE